MSFEPRETQGQAHLNDYLRMLWKHRWLLTAVFLLTAVTGVIWTLAQTPIYQASATVLIEPELPKILNIQEITNPGMGSLEYYRTQYALMTSRPVMENTVAALKRQGRSAALAALGAGTDPRVKHMGVVSVEPIRNTQLVLVRFEHSDPVLAAEVATTVAQAYVKYNLDSKLKGSRDALVWLNEQMSSLKTKVEESSVALQNYRVKAGILGIQEQRVLTAQKAQEVNRSHLDAQARRLSIESKLRELNRIAKEQASTDSLTTSIEDPLIGKLKAEMADLQVQRSKLLQTYKDKHPEVLKVDAQIQQLAQRMDAEIQKSLRALDTEYKVARAREDSLMGAVNRLRSEEGDRVLRPPARGGFEPAAVRGDAQAPEGDGRGGRPRHQQRARGRGRARAGNPRAPAQDLWARDERAPRAGAGRGRRGGRRVLRPQRQVTGGRRAVARPARDRRRPRVRVEALR